MTMSLYWQPSISDKTVYQTFSKSDIGVIYKTLCSMQQFHENQCRKSHTLLWCVKCCYIHTSHAYYPTGVKYLTAGPKIILYSTVSQTVVRGPQVVLGFCPCGPFRLNISPKKTEKTKLT